MAVTDEYAHLTCVVEGDGQSEVRYVICSLDGGQCGTADTVHDTAHNVRIVDIALDSDEEPHVVWGAAWVEGEEEMR